jgi:pyruvate dehydrogenase E2 component (dihydrolipoamide acetyltransferase)
MIQQILMPKLGETMTEASVEKWRKAEGDPIRKGDVILEITTDKATLEVESSIVGILKKILAPEKVTLPVNTVIALAGEPADALPDNLDELLAAARGEKAAAASAARPASEGASAAAPADVEVEPEAVSGPAGRILVSPRARMRAKEARVPLQVLRGSGPGGRIIEKDVSAYLARREQVRATPTAIELACERGVDLTALRGSGPGGKISKEDVLAAQPAPARRAAARERRVELTAMRRIVAERMAKSKREAPHFYLTMEVDMTAAAALRAKLNADLPAEAAALRSSAASAGGAESAKAGGKMHVGFHDLLIRACATSLGENPLMNVTWGGDHIRVRAEINIGLAVALDEGLIVPVIRNADRLDLAATARASAQMIEKARSKRLLPGEYEGGCLTISNLGMFDVDNFIPVINPGESAILGRIAQKPVVIAGAVQVRSMMSCTLSADHRAVDGAIAARFLKRVKELLEKPEDL